MAKHLDSTVSILTNVSERLAESRADNNFYNLTCEGVSRVGQTTCNDTHNHEGKHSGFSIVTDRLLTWGKHRG